MKCNILIKTKDKEPLCTLLSKLGLEVQIFKRPGEVTSYLQTYDGSEIFIIDNEFNDINEIIKNIKSKQESQKIYKYVFVFFVKFIFDNYIKLLRLGIDNFLLYPFRELEVLEKIKRAQYIIKLQTSMQEEEAPYLHLFKNNLQPMLIFDHNKLIKDINSAACALLGLRCEDARDTDIMNLLQIEEEQGILFWDDLKKHNRRRFFMDCFVNNKKKYLDIKVGEIVIQGKDYFYASINDITELREIELELKKAYSENEVIINSINSVLIYIDNDKYIFRWNREAENLFGISTGRAIGQKLTDLDIEWNIDRIIQTINDCKQGSTHISDINFVDKNGNVRILSISIYPIYKNSHLHGHLMLGKDVTEKKILESQLLHSQKLEAIGELAAGIAHEINTPVQYVYGNLTYIKDILFDLLDLMEKYKIAIDRIPDNGEIIDYHFKQEIKDKEQGIDIEFLREDIPNALNESIHGLEQVIQIVKSMRDFSHSGQQEKKLFDINKAIQDTVTISRNVWKYHSDIKLELEDDLPPVYGFGDEINQVLLNIIVNAAHAITEKIVSLGIEEKGLITIRTLNKGDMVEIQIQDTGSGIPKSIRDKIFDPFFTTKEVGKGTGQGLYLSYNIIRKHNGRIYFESEEGKGTVFYIQLPVAKDDTHEEIDKEEFI